ncbi:MAG: ATP synthase F1 subunit delta [Rickettsiales bacterium]|nr:ATP synthase F1 subunit delta [Rickettsiales bacterium]|tara:strand:- start:57486 stop:58037 length:552 start_codon:yes stop_codon:yes gene_type:complete
MSINIEKVLLIDHFCDALLAKFGVKDVQNFYNFLNDLKGALDQNPSLKRFFESPRTSGARMSRFFSEIKKDFSSIDRESLIVMAEFALLEDIQAVLERLDLAVSRAKGIVKVDVFSAKKLGKKEEKEICDKLESMDVKDITLENHVDPSLLKGYKMRWNNQVYDASLKKQLDELQNTLMGIKA